MKVHLIGICGTGMGTLAGLLKAAGHDVRGSDEHVYPPMSLQLADQQIPCFEGFRPANLDWGPDARRRRQRVPQGSRRGAGGAGDGTFPLESFPSLFSKLFLDDPDEALAPLGGRRRGTHGKTTTSSLLAHALTDAEAGSVVPDRRRAAELPPVVAPRRRRRVRHRRRRVRHGVLRQGIEVPALPAARSCC